MHANSRKACPSLRAVILLALLAGATSCQAALSLVVNTWPFTVATQAGWDRLQQGSALDAVEAVRPLWLLWASCLHPLATAQACMACRALQPVRRHSVTLLSDMEAPQMSLVPQLRTPSSWTGCAAPLDLPVADHMQQRQQQRSSLRQHR